jgi:hypothetical protein
MPPSYLVPFIGEPNGRFLFTCLEVKPGGRVLLAEMVGQRESIGRRGTPSMREI